MTFDALRARQDAFVRWLEAYVGAIRSRARLTSTEKRVLAVEHESQPNLAALLGLFDRGYSRAQAYRRAFEAMPSDDPQLAVARRDLLKAAGYEVSAWHEYAAGLRAKDIPRVERGDAVAGKGRRYLLAATKTGEDLYRKLGGAKAFTGRSDFEHIGSLLEELRTSRHT